MIHNSDIVTCHEIQLLCLGKRYTAREIRWNNSLHASFDSGIDDRKLRSCSEHNGEVDDECILAFQCKDELGFWVVVRDLDDGLVGVWDEA